MSDWETVTNKKQKLSVKKLKKCLKNNVKKL